MAAFIIDWIYTKRIGDGYHRVVPRYDAIRVNEVWMGLSVSAECRQVYWYSKRYDRRNRLQRVFRPQAVG